MVDDPVLALKKAAGDAAARRVQSGMVVGLGTGSTAIHAIRCLGQRLRDRDLRDIRGIPTSFQASVIARELRIPLASLDDVDKIDVAIDGADEVAPDLTLIKGGGAAHTREKIVDALAHEFIVVVDETKLVDKLGSKFPVPVEVLPYAFAPVVTDQGNFVVDVKFNSIPDPAGLESTINNIPGVLENGLFVGVAHRVLFGTLENGKPVVRERVRR
jgi:ribose 5-phosphate isomerase A